MNIHAKGRQIIERCCAEATEATEVDVTVADVLGPRRTYRIAPVRLLAMAEMAAEGFTHAEIATVVGRKRSTVSHLLKGVDSNA